MKKTTQRNFLIGLALLAILLGLTRPDKTPELEEAVPARVLVASVTTHDLLPDEVVSGHLEPMRKAALHFELNGQVRERLVEPGQRVEAGATLLALDDGDYRDASDRAGAQLQLERSNIDKDRELLKLARRNHDLQQSEVTRLEKLGKDSLVSRSRLDESRIKRLQLQSEVAQLRNSTDTAESRLQLLESERNRAERDLLRTQLQAPFTGIVNRVDAEIGDYVTPGIAVAELIDISSLDLYAEVRGELAQALSHGQQVVVTADGKAIDGTLVALQTDPDPQTFTHALRVRIPGDAAHSGSVARVRLPLQPLRQVIAIPTTAILQDEGNAWVFRLDSDVLVRRRVITGMQVDELVVIRDGLAAGDTVVVRDVAALSDGLRVNAVVTDQIARPEQ